MHVAHTWKPVSLVVVFSASRVSVLAVYNVVPTPLGLYPEDVLFLANPLLLSQQELLYFCNILMRRNLIDWLYLSSDLIKASMARSSTVSILWNGMRRIHSSEFLRGLVFPALHQRTMDLCGLLVKGLSV